MRPTRRGGSVPTEVMYEQGAPEYKDPKPSRSSKTTINNINNNIRDKIPVKVPIYKFIETNKETKRPTPESNDETGKMPTIKMDERLFGWDSKVNDPSSFKSTIFGNQYIEKGRLDHENIQTTGNHKTIANQKMNIPDPKVTNKLKKTFRSGFQVYDPSFKPKGVDHLLLMGSGESLFKPYVGKARLKIGGIQSMTRMKYNAQFD